MMNRLTLSYLVLLVFGGMLLFSCNKEEDDNWTPGDNTIDTTHGELTFKVFFESDTLPPLQGALVGIGRNQDNIDLGIATHSGISSSLGKVEFELLDSGRYYYFVSKNILGTVYKKTGSVPIDGGDDITREVVLN